MCVLTLEISHCPDGNFTCFALVLAGRRCIHQQWHGDLLIVHHHGQHSWICACSHSKLPIAPMGISYVLCLCLQGGGVFIDSGTVTFLSCTVTGNTPNSKGGGVYVQSGSVTFSSCTFTGNTPNGHVRAHVQKFPSPRWEFHMFCACACRAAVFTSGVAR